MPTELRDFLTHSYAEREELNLASKEKRKNGFAGDKLQEEQSIFVEPVLGELAGGRGGFKLPIAAGERCAPPGS